MSKRIKMAIYGAPGVGKSVFASKFPKPFFICTDGNYDWLLDFGAEEQAHADCQTWEQIKYIITHPDLLKGYETVVIDLLEDAFSWCEREYCVRRGIESVGDLEYGKGYAQTRDEFFIYISKLLALDFNIVLIMHSTVKVEKDARGKEIYKTVPCDRIPEKVIDRIEGRVRYFLRAFARDETHADGAYIKKRYLALIDSTNNYSVHRGINENDLPREIPLDFDVFLKTIGFTADEISKSSGTSEKKGMTFEIPKAKPKQKVILKAETPKAEVPKAEAPKAETPKAETPKAEPPKAEAPKAETPKAETPKAETPKAETPKKITKKESDELDNLVSKLRQSVNESPAAKPAEEPPKANVSNADKIAMIKAKLKQYQN